MGIDRLVLAYLSAMRRVVPERSRMATGRLSRMRSWPVRRAHSARVRQEGFTATSLPLESLLEKRCSICLIQLRQCVLFGVESHQVGEEQV